MDGKKSISNLFSYAVGSKKNPLTESESRKHSICTIYNGKNCLTPCYGYPYYIPNIQSFDVIEEHFKNENKDIKKFALESPSDVNQIKRKRRRCLGTLTIVVLFLIVLILISTSLYLNAANIEKFIQLHLE
uniref:Unspecified product n=1 Tax=Strongyloides stercoralis TaxID=6248 RepID=A0A0K0DSU4_STRER